MHSDRGHDGGDVAPNARIHECAEKMSWLFELHKTQPIAHTVGMLAFVCVLGMALGSLKLRGIGLGTSGVLFAGILVGHFGEAVDHQMLDFVKEFGLILFVFTVLPLLLVGIFARVVLKMNFMDLSGLLAGSMTDPPALAFASNIAGSDAPTVAYATVYPLTTLLHILSAQVLAIFLFR